MREVVMEGPQAPEGQQFCVLCAMRYKAEVLALPEVEQHVQSLMRGEGPPIHVDMIEPARKALIKAPGVAVATGICPQLNNALVPLCWGHVQAVKFTPLAAGDASQVPLLTGRR